MHLRWQVHVHLLLLDSVLGMPAHLLLDPVPWQTLLQALPQLASDPAAPWLLMRCSQAAVAELAVQAQLQPTSPRPAVELAATNCQHLAPPSAWS